MSPLQKKLAPQVRLLWLFVLAMVVVPLIFAAIVLVIGSQAPADPAPIQGEIIEARGGEVVGQVALVTGLIALVLQQWMRRWVTGQAVQNLRIHAMGSPERLGEAYLTGVIVACAICEMASFLNLIAYMASQAWTNLGMGLLLAASNATRLPSTPGVAAWVERSAGELGIAVEEEGEAE